MASGAAAAMRVSAHSAACTSSSSTPSTQTMPLRASHMQNGFVNFSGLRACGKGNVASLVLSSSTQISDRQATRLTPTVAAVSAIPQQKLRIKLRSYESPSIEAACAKIIAAASATETKAVGPIPLPTKRKIWCVLRSPHVDKDSREHFQMLTHRRIIDLENPSAQTIDALMQLDLPAGVDVEVKLK